MKKLVLSLCVLLSFMFIFGACGEQSADPVAEEYPEFSFYDASVWPPPEDPRTFEERTAVTIPATITMDDGSEIELRLFPDLAPQSVMNFVSLARQGYYDGLKFHRIMYDFMIQGGCPDGTGTGNPGYNIRGEFRANGFMNGLSHTRGVLSMARASAYDSGGSQFFIVHNNSTGLDGDYAAFGVVVAGIEVVDKIAETPNDGPNGSVAPEDMPIIRSITIDSGVTLPEPYKM